MVAGGGMHGCWGVCMAKESMHGKGGMHGKEGLHVWQRGAVCTPYEIRPVNAWTVCILLECILFKHEFVFSDVSLLGVF